jgi:hypothetical protein
MLFASFDRVCERSYLRCVLLLVACGWVSTAAAQITVSGVVQTQSSAAVSGASLEFRQAQVVVDSDTSKQDGTYITYSNAQVTGSSAFKGHTDASGKLTLRVLPGTGSLLVKPPSGSELGTQTAMVMVADQAQDPAPLTVMLDLAQTSTYSGRVLDRHGVGFAGLRAMLTDSNGMRARAAPNPIARGRLRWHNCSSCEAQRC